MSFGVGVWSHRITDFGGEGEVEAHAERLAEAGVDLIIPCVKNPPGWVDFFTEHAEVGPNYPDWDPLMVLIASCKDLGIKVHPWFCVFTEGRGSRLLAEHPEYAASLDSERRWACACRPEVQQYVLELYKDLATRYKPDGLHLDYIRTGGLCRCEYCKQEMATQGVDVEQVRRRDPGFQRWVEWRTSRVSSFVRALHDFASKAGLEVSAAVFADYPSCVEEQGQDWVGWSEAGIVDLLCPMNYTNSTLSVRSRTICHLSLVKGRTPIWEGLGRSSSISELTPRALSAQARSVIELGAQGFVVFHYGALNDSDLEEIRMLKRRGIDS